MEIVSLTIASCLHFVFITGNSLLNLICISNYKAMLHRVQFTVLYIVINDLMIIIYKYDKFRM